jgi:mono/diheme cytochrome c family protein
MSALRLTRVGSVASVVAAALFASAAHASDGVPLPIALVGRLHFQVLHFPIALFFVAAIVFFLLRGRLGAEPRRELLRIIVMLAAVSAVVTVVSGLAYAQGEDFSGSTADTFEAHRNVGIAVAVFAVVAALAARGAFGLSKALGPLLIVLCVGVTYVGHHGGELVHGAGFLTRPLRTDVVADDKDDDDDDDKEDDGAVVARERHPEGTAPETPDYIGHIKPVFERSCVKCHGPEKRKGGLRLDQKRFAMKGGETGENAIIPGNAAKSLVFMMSSHPPDDEDVMPPKGKLLALSELETIKRWIDQGATWPEN